MKLKISWKLFFIFSTIIVVLLTGLYLYLTPLLKEGIIQESTKKLTEELYLVAEIFDNDDQKLSSIEMTDAWVDRVSQKIESRLTFIDNKGVVLGDSELSMSEVTQIDNHLNRVEIQQALQDGVGHSLRYSSTLKTQMLYVALKTKNGYVRLALPLKKIDQVLKQVKNSILIASLGTLLIGLSILAFFIYRMSHFLQQLTSFASKLSRGDFSGHIRISGKDERGQMASSLNDMAQSLEILITRIEKDRNRFESVLESIHEGVLVTNSQGKISLANMALKQQFVKKDDPKSKTPLEYFENEEIQKLVNDTLALKRSYQKEIHIKNNWIDKSFHVFAAPVSNDHGSVSVFHDITQIRRLENLRKEFVANVSHEFKTPLTSILGYCETLITHAKQQDDTTKRFLKIIERNAQHLRELVEDLLQISRIESGQFQISMQTIDVHQVLRAIVDDVRQKAIDHNIKIVLHIPPDPMWVRSDNQALLQIFSNLVDNAIKYTPGEGEVVIASVEDGDKVKISVKDQGIGIHKEEMPRIFERFYRVDPSRSKVEGTGLGLSIVKHLVQSHGAEVHVESEPGQGSKFVVTFTRVEMG